MQQPKQARFPGMEPKLEDEISAKAFSMERSADKALALYENLREREFVEAISEPVSPGERLAMTQKNTR
jgi:hypothetical protein